MKRVILVIFILSITMSTFATGPSYIYAEMNPISVNEKGEVLCRTRFLKNDMGGHWFNRIEYGLCVLTDGKIIEFTTKILDPDIIALDDKNPNRAKKEVTMEEYISMQDHWNWVFKISLDFDKLSNQQKKICDEYGFKENNAANYKVDKTYSTATFEKERDIDLKKQRQKSLKNGQSISDSLPDKVKVLYDFGKIILLQNEDDADESSIGFRFDYINPIFGYQNLEYEAHYITGVLFLN